MKNIFMIFALLIFSKTVFACNWSVTVLEQEKTVVSISLGDTVPEKTAFNIPGVASCNVCNDGQIYTICTYNKTKNSVIVTPMDDKFLGQMSNMMIFDGNMEEDVKKFVVLTMCSG